MPPSGALRARVGTVAAQAWGRAGEPKKAVRYYEDVAERAPHPDSRLEGLLGARGCYVQMGKPDEAANAMKRVRREMAMLDDTQRKVWEMEMRAVQREQRNP
jgi:lipopolysaccharide biosynthesis regulator YciM